MKKTDKYFESAVNLYDDLKIEEAKKMANKFIDAQIKEVTSNKKITKMQKQELRNHILGSYSEHFAIFNSLLVDKLLKN